MTALIPFPTGSITLCHSRIAAAAIASHAFLIAGQAVPTIQSTVAWIATLIAPHTAWTILRKVSECLYAYTMAATRAMIANVTSTNGFRAMIALKAIWIPAQILVAALTSWMPFR